MSPSSRMLARISSLRAVVTRPLPRWAISALRAEFGKGVYRERYPDVPEDLHGHLRVDVERG
jgi:hypothetical protein